MQLSAQLIAFVIAAAVGAAPWHVVASAQQEEARRAAQEAPRVTNANVSDAGQRAASDDEAPAAETTAETSSDAGVASEVIVPRLQWSEVQTAWASANVARVTLRERPEPGAPAVATLRLLEYDSAEILDWTRDRVKVKFAANSDAEGGTRRRDYEGWVGWGAVRPGALAIVLDAESGEVFARVPFAANVTSATFSPDGRRVLFHGEGLTLAYEASTKDYKPARVLESTTTGGFGQFFYGAGGELYAPVLTVAYDESRTETSLDVLRVGEDRGAETGAGVRTRLTSGKGTTFLVAADGLTGIMIRREPGWQGSSEPAERSASGGADASGRSATVEVLDLQTLAARSSFTLYGREAPDETSQLAVSRDGAELYVKTPGEEEVIHVFDTRSGVRLRDIKLELPGLQWAMLAGSAPLGDTLLLKTFLRAHEDEGEAVEGSVWVGGEKPVEAEAGIDHVVEAGGARYAVNTAGTQLLKLDSQNRVTERLSIARPEIKRAAETVEELNVFGLTATPDGKHLILFVGMPECGC